MRDYIAIIGATAAITSASVFAAIGGLSDKESSTNRSSSTSAVAIEQVSVPVSVLPEGNGERLRNKLAQEKRLAKAERGKSQSKKPVITIEEIDPEDRKQSIKAKLEEAKAEEVRKAQARKRSQEKREGLERREAELKKKEAEERKATEEKKAAQANKKAEQETDAKEADEEEAYQKALLRRIREMQGAHKKPIQTPNPTKPKAGDDSQDPGRIIFADRPQPVAVPDKDELQIPAPMELINANTSLLTRIVNSRAGPSPEELHGMWEVMPCHSRVGVIATRSFKTTGLAHGSGAYFEIVQFYSDRKRKVLGPRSETTIYVKLDQQHMLAAVNANTNMPKFSVLRKISSEIQEEPDELEEEATKAVLPGQKKRVNKPQRSSDSKRTAREKGAESTSGMKSKKNRKADKPKSGRTSDQTI